ncbi:MAG: hypothetical protein GF334_10570, partial [Candidatus Altiarchaeales archaeon]|nr:hypothetical protein [Candidatus Altiarchaeales archaeon]
MKQRIQQTMKKYGCFVSKHPFLILVLSLLVTVFAANLQASLEVVSQDDKDFLPSDRPVVAAFEKIQDEFGGLNTIQLAVEVDPQTPNSNEVRDVLDPRAIEYSHTIGQKMNKLPEILSTQSASTLLKEGNGGVLPKSVETSRDLFKQNPSLTQYVSEDHSILLIKAEAVPDYEDEQ